MSIVRALAWVVAAGIVALPLVQPGGPLGPDLALASGALSVSGAVTDLRPGVPAPLVLTVSNDGGTDVVVAELRVAVVGGGTPTCPATSLRIAPWRGRLVVPGGGSAAQPVEVLLDPDVHCGPTSWSLEYTAVPA